MHFKTIFFKNKFEISYFNSRRMQFPSQLPGLGTGASVLNNELALSPLKEAKASRTGSALPQHPCLHGAEPSTSCPLQQAGSGPRRRHKTPLSSGQPGRAGRGFWVRSRTNGFGTHSSLLANGPTSFSAPIPFRWESCYPHTYRPEGY